MTSTTLAARTATRRAAETTAVDPDDLVHRNLSLVDAIARTAARDLPAHVDVDDLVAYGRVGLIEASRRYDPSYGVAFKTFAWCRIRGAIYNGLRQLTNYRGSSTADLLYQEQATDLLGQAALSRGVVTGGAGPDDLADLEEVVEGVAAAWVLAHGGDDTIDPSPGPEAAAVANDTAARLRACVADLPERERILIEACYFRHQTISDAGAELGLSKSWASRLHARALTHLNELAREAGLDDVA
jgi:RNA polymerase sigma factor for flagellar operon FliA